MGIIYRILRNAKQVIYTVGTSSESISLTCILCKVMEHIVASNLAQHLNKTDILYGLQHGFLEKRSCKTHLIELVWELCRKLSNGHKVDLVLLDFSKAFDKVNHLKLFLKEFMWGGGVKSFFEVQYECVYLTLII